MIDKSEDYVEFSKDSNFWSVGGNVGKRGEEDDEDDEEDEEDEEEVEEKIYGSLSFSSSIDLLFLFLDLDCSNASLKFR